MKTRIAAYIITALMVTTGSVYPAQMKKTSTKIAVSKKVQYKSNKKKTAAISMNYRPSVKCTIKHRWLRTKSMIRVDASRGDDETGDGSSESPFKTITRALEEAVSGDSIVVEPGNYDLALGEEFPIRMKQGVRLVGIRNEGSITFGSHPLSGRASEVTLPDMPIIVGSAPVTVETGDGDVDYLVAVLGVGRSTIINFAISTHILGWDPGDSKVGVLCSNTSPTIIGNLFFGCCTAGIVVTGRGAPTIENNYFEGYSLRWGIDAGGNGDPEITDNEFLCIYGARFTGRSRAVVSDNTFSCHYTGLVIGGQSAPIIDDNTVSGHHDWGLSIEDDACPAILNNEITDNGDVYHMEDGWMIWEGGIGIFDNARPDLGGGGQSTGGNYIHDNNNQDVSNYSRNDIWALDNYWTDDCPFLEDGLYIFDDEDRSTSGKVLLREDWAE